MKKIIMLLLAVSGLTAISLADDLATEYSQTYAIFLNGSHSHQLLFDQELFRLPYSETLTSDL